MMLYELQSLHDLKQDINILSAEPKKKQLWTILFKHFLSHKYLMKMLKQYSGSHMKCQSLLSTKGQNWTWTANFNKNPEQQILLKCVKTGHL
jgi:hypothetical protein